jgi:hypothetical protein
VSCLNSPAYAKYNRSYEGAATLEAARTKVKLSRAIIKIGLDVHARLSVAVAQYDHLLPKAARRLRPERFVP